MRDIRIDFLRALGLILIILAHVGPPKAIAALRSFDVPMMILMSGISYGISTGKIDYGKYLVKRFKRLVLPTWVFLTLFFLVVLAFGLKSPALNKQIILTSYTLTSGIGYVWIIRVFFIVALLSPFISYFNNTIKSNTVYLLIILLTAVANEVLIQYLLKINSEGVHGFLKNMWDGVTYSLVFAVGLRLYQYTSKNYAGLLAGAAFLFFGYAAYYYHSVGHVVTPGAFKYPPQLYFLAYSVLVATLLWLVSTYVVKVSQLNGLWLFLGGNTLWIYFWHIVILCVLPVTLIKSFINRYLFVLLLATGIYYLHYIFVKRFVLVRITNDNVRKTVKNIFLG